MRGSWRWARSWALAALALAAFAAAAPPAGATLTLAPGKTTLELLDASGGAEDQAGAHPDRLLQAFELIDADEPHEEVKEMVTELPAGLSGNPDAVPLCPRSELNALFGKCPAKSQVGRLLGGESESGIPLYDVEPAPNQSVVLAAVPAYSPIFFIGQLRPADQGLSLRLSGIEQSSFFKLTGGTIELWGVPADHQEGTSIPRKPFLTTPTRCDGQPLTVDLSFRSWQQPDRWLRGSGDSGHPLIGCENLRFDPSLAFSLEEPRADVPSGARIDLTVPQNDNPDGLATSQVESASILLPEGMTLSPGSASGLESCADDRFGLGTAADPDCPPASRIGSVELAAPALDKPMTGAIYLGRERAGERLRLLIAASARGAEMKFAGSLQTDSATGRLTARLDGLPQATFASLSMRFDGGPDALLATPLSCGPAKTAATLTPSSGGPAVDWTGSVSVATAAGKACAGPAPFAPKFSGGSTEVVAGRATAFTATVRREDGEQLPERLEVAFPPGMSAALGQVEPCAEAAIAKAACPASSGVGKTVAELGPGNNPARLAGDIYLTGPYRRAPFGIALVFKAAIGPFDLGTLTIRGAVRVDSLSGQVTVVTDAMPSVVEGIPIRFQTLGLDLDRPGFIHNPTSCGPASVSASLRSDRGAAATVSSPFQVRDCIALPFRPAFTVGLTASEQLHDGGKPGLRIGGRVPAGNANLRMADVSLPPVLRFDSSGLREICARGAARAGRCPKRSRVGFSSARTPLLKAPLKGPIYVVQPEGTGSPDLWMSLEGGGLQVELKGETKSEDGRVETRLVDLPDFPLSSFSMRLASGERGLFELDGSPCHRLRAPLTLRGQNGAVRKARVPLGTAKGCGQHG